MAKAFDNLTDEEKIQLNQFNEDRKKSKEEKKQRLKDAWGRPKKYLEKTNELIQKERDLLSTKLDFNKQSNQLSYRYETDPYYTKTDLAEDNARLTREYYNTEKTDADGNLIPLGKIILLEQDIQQLKEEINALDNNFFGLKDPNKKKKEETDKKQYRELRKKERKNKEKKKSNLRLLLILRARREPNKLRSVVNIISFIATTYLERCGVNNAKIDILVDEVNILIDNIKTPQDIVVAKNKRDSALLYISLERNYLRATEKLINDIGLITAILDAIIALMQLLPPLVYSPKIERIIKRIEEVIADLTGLFTTSTFLIQALLADLDEAEARLRELSNILDQNLENLTSDQIQALQDRGLGYLTGYDYKGFRFFLKEEENPKPEFIIKGNKRRYAIALDLSDRERLKSEYSFTLEPDVLIEQLKVEIDKQNLVA